MFLRFLLKIITRSVFVMGRGVDFYEVSKKVLYQSQIRDIFLAYKVKVNESRNRPGVAQSAPGGLGSQIFMTFDT
jgi:hypothetical protein